ncbi:MAG: hypothetical protein COA47_06740 [Robiginitomaculum sp.]|nr:MAG: hypothetical protein COA47_06740 [Robiginitomaculum sp.]
MIRSVLNYGGFLLLNLVKAWQAHVSLREQVSPLHEKFGCEMNQMTICSDLIHEHPLVEYVI